MTQFFRIPTRLLAFLTASVLLWMLAGNSAADWCKYEKDTNLTLDLSDSDSLEILAAAGDLTVTGVAGSEEAVIYAKACASKESWLAASEVLTSTGEQATIKVKLPDTDSGFSLFGGNYAWLDLQLDVPQHLALEFMDSSGDIYGTRVDGDFVVERDSSGDIRAKNIGGDFRVLKDGSGGIRSTDVRGVTQLPTGK
jgi:hypothetical protein